MYVFFSDVGLSVNLFSSTILVTLVVVEQREACALLALARWDR